MAPACFFLCSAALRWAFSLGRAERYRLSSLCPASPDIDGGQGFGVLAFSFFRSMWIFVGYGWCAIVPDAQKTAHLNTLLNTSDKGMKLKENYYSQKSFQSKTKEPQNLRFKAQMLELLGRFELPTSSLQKAKESLQIIGAKSRCLCNSGLLKNAGIGRQAEGNGRRAQAKGPTYGWRSWQG